MKVVMNLFELINELERTEGRKYSLAEISDGSGISRQSLSALINDPEVKMIRTDTLVSLSQFFQSRGIKAGIEDLLVFRGDDEGKAMPAYEVGAALA